MDAFVKKELRYPKEAITAKVEGRVSVRYTVDYKGKVIEAGVISGIGHGCDEEALRIVRSFQFKTPADGKIKSKYTRTVHIHFRLPGSQAKLSGTKPTLPPVQGMQIQYQLTPTPSSPTKQQAAKSSSYQITIEMPGKNKINP